MRYLSISYQIMLTDYKIISFQASLVAQMVKNLTAMQETQV